MKGNSPRLMISKVLGLEVVLYVKGPKLMPRAGVTAYLVNTALGGPGGCGGGFRGGWGSAFGVGAQLLGLGGGGGGDRARWGTGATACTPCLHNVHAMSWEVLLNIFDLSHPTPTCTHSPSRCFELFPASTSIPALSLTQPAALPSRCPPHHRPPAPPTPATCS